MRPIGYNNWRECAMSYRRRAGVRAVWLAIKAGQLPPPKTLICVDCGKGAFCYDHRDYRKPLAVDPVCKSCDSMRGPGKPYYAEGTPQYASLLAKAKIAYRERHKTGRPRGKANGK